MECNICGSKRFEAGGSGTITKCSQCGSIVRSRLFYLYFLREKFSHKLRVLHLSPSKCMYNIFHMYFGRGYVTADLTPQKFPYAKNMLKIDLNSMDDQPSCQYDLIIHSHVLNAIKCNYAVALHNLFRLLKFSGFMMCIIPFSSGKYKENLNDLSDEERESQFHHKCIMRRFGIEDIDNSLGQLININKQFNPEADFGADILQKFNIPIQQVKGLNTSTVLILKKSDYKLQSIFRPSKGGVGSPEDNLKDHLPPNMFAECYSERH